MVFHHIYPGIMNACKSSQMLLVTRWARGFHSECILKSMFLFPCRVGGSVSDVAHEVVLPKVPDKTCKYIWGIQAKYRLCAGKQYAKVGICPVSNYVMYCIVSTLSLMILKGMTLSFILTLFLIIFCKQAIGL